MLLGWHHVKCVNWKKENKLVEWLRIVASGKPPPPCNRWTDGEEERLGSLSADKIDIGDTAYGRELVLKQR